MSQCRKRIDDDDSCDELFSVGAIVSSPRACMRAASISAKAAFVYLNLEDLTATSFSSSKEDADKFLPSYLKEFVFRSNPFKTIDEQGVGLLAQTVLRECQHPNRVVPCGVIEGDQTGDPDSVRFLCESGFTLISCAPSDISMVRIAAAKSHIHTTTGSGEKKTKCEFFTQPDEESPCL